MEFYGVFIMAKKKRYSVRVTEGIYRNVVHSMSFPEVEEAEAAFSFVCSLDDSFPMDVELASYNYDEKTKTTSMWACMRFRKFFTERNERRIFEELCRQVHSEEWLLYQAQKNEEKPYGTVCDLIKDQYTYEQLSLEKQSKIAEAVCNFYGIAVK